MDAKAIWCEECGLSVDVTGWGGWCYASDGSFSGAVRHCADDDHQIETWDGKRWTLEGRRIRLSPTDR